MSLLVSQRSCHIWHRHIRCVQSLKIVASTWRITYRFYSDHHAPSIKKTRNIGIIAHIDAVSFILNPCFFSMSIDCWIGENYNHGANALLQWLYPSNRRYDKKSQFLLLIPFICLIVTALMRDDKSLFLRSS